MVPKALRIEDADIKAPVLGKLPQLGRYIVKVCPSSGGLDSDLPSFAADFRVWHAATDRNIEKKGVISLSLGNLLCKVTDMLADRGGTCSGCLLLTAAELFQHLGSFCGAVTLPCGEQLAKIGISQAEQWGCGGCCHGSE